MLDLIARLNNDGIQWEYVFNENEKQLYIKYDNKLVAWYF